jgi:PEGA domain
MCRQGFTVLLTAAVAVASIGILVPAGEAWQRQATPREPPQQTDPGGEQRKAVPRSEAPERKGTEPEQRRAVPRPSAPQQPDARRQGTSRREPPQRREVPRRYFAGPRAYYFPPVDVRLGFYYHPYFGFYYGPYYGPFYPFPGPYVRPARYSASAVRMRVKPVETEVYVNGYYAGIVDDFDGVFERLYVPAGEHHVELHLDGYASFREDLYVGPGDTFEIVHQMQRLRAGEVSTPPPGPRAVPEEWTAPVPNATGDQPASPYGILAIRAEPSDAQILVDGEAWAPAEGQSEFVIHLPEGWHQLDVRKDGYQPFSTRLELSEGQTTRLKVQLTQ